LASPSLIVHGDAFDFDWSAIGGEFSAFIGIQKGFQIERRSPAGGLDLA
jgi:hypothetical protein